MSIDKRKLTNRYFTGVFYKEDQNYEKYIENIITNFEEFAYIDHNRDLNEIGETKKPHTHIVFKVGDNARHRKSIANIIGCQENMIEGCNKDKMLLYLIHANNPEKTQYNISEVQGTLKNYLIRLLSRNIDTSTKIENIIEFIELNKINNVTDVVRFCIHMNYTEILRSYQYIIRQIIEENKIRKK